MTHGLGRRPAPDPRDRNYPMRALVPFTFDVPFRYWYAHGWWGDQGETSQCVGYAWAHWLEDGPAPHRDVPAPIRSPEFIYQGAQMIDEWPGEGYDGTSVRAGAKVLQVEGLISSYLWAFDVGTVIDAVMTTGPVVVGTNWYRGMFEPVWKRASNTVMKATLEISGSVAGGHAYVLDGYNVGTELFRMKNSWGREWGDNGFAYISAADMERLINEEGEAALAVEVAT